MTIKQYYENELKSNIDNDLYEKAKKEVRTYKFLVFFFVFLGITILGLVIIFSSLIGDTISISQIDPSSFAGLIPFIGATILFKIFDSINKSKSQKDEYIYEKYVEVYLKKINLDLFKNIEYSKEIIDFNIDKRFKFNKLVVDYNKQLKSIRIFDYKKLSDTICLNNILEYKLLDEGDVVYQCKRNDLTPLNKINYNRFECKTLELVITYITQNSNLSTVQYLVLKEVDRDDDTYKNDIVLLLNLFNMFDIALLEKVNNTTPKENEEAFEGDNKAIYDKLVQLKKLYEDGLIDRKTYEEKKSKLVDSL